MIPNDILQVLTQSFVRSQKVDEAEGKREEIKRLKMDIARLNLESRMYKQGHSQGKLDVNDSVMITYCKAWNLDFTQKMQTKLPRELRDMVYSYIWDENEYAHWRDRVRFVLRNRRAVCTKRFCDCLESLVTKVPHYVNKDFVTKATATKMAEIVYNNLDVEKSTFVTFIAEEIQIVLHNDLLHLGIDPIEFIGSLHVFLAVDTSLVDRPCGCIVEAKDSGDHAPASKQLIQQSTLLSLLSPLFDARRKRGFYLLIGVTLSHTYFQYEHVTPVQEGD